jgi:hypothetical protein
MRRDGRERLRGDAPGYTPMSEQTYEQVEAPRMSEREKVEFWRLGELIRCGYPVPVAEKLACSDADLHRAIELVKVGCEPALAAKILL